MLSWQNFIELIGRAPNILHLLSATISHDLHFSGSLGFCIISPQYNVVSLPASRALFADVGHGWQGFDGAACVGPVEGEEAGVGFHFSITAWLSRLVFTMSQTTLHILTFFCKTEITSLRSSGCMAQHDLTLT